MEVYPRLPLDPMRLHWHFNALLVIILRRRRVARRRWWVRPIYQERRNQGDFHHLIQEMRLRDTDMYFNYFRMSVEMFDTLLGHVGPQLRRASMSREVISPGERLSATIRYLAAGDSMTSLCYQYRIGKSTMSGIIAETCEVLWHTLKDRVFPFPTTASWRRISSSFWEKWNFPNCIGAIDGKHIVMQAPENSGSEFYNYKGTHSIILLASCDANYEFTVVDIGAAGRQSDGGVFKNSLFGRLLEEGNLGVPPPALLPGTDYMAPHVFVGDEAFPLKNYLLRPFPGRNSTNFQRIFNYRLSRARRVIENAFGIMAARFRLLRRPILGNIGKVERCTKAIVCLHNWIIQNEGPRNRMYCPAGFADFERGNGEVVPGRWRGEGENGGMRDVARIGTNNARRDNYEMRELFAMFFSGAGSVPWQWNL